MNVLFVCARNRLRSPTAERIFADRAETDSARLAPDADVRVSGDQIEWADLIVVMEKSQRAKLAKKFGRQLTGRRVVCIDVPDRYEFMQPELIDLLEKRMARYF